MRIYKEGETLKALLINMADGPTPIEQNSSRPMDKLKGFLERFRKPSPVRHNQTSESRPTIKAKLISEGQEKSPTTTTPAPTTEVKREEPPVVPEIKNSYGTISNFQATIDGMKDGKWQYAIRIRDNSDASHPRGRLLMTGASKDSDGTVLHFTSMDEALDFALAKNREKTTKIWFDALAQRHEDVEEDPTIHYDPREKPAEEVKAS